MDQDHSGLPERDLDRLSGSGLRGLSEPEAAARLAHDGPNTVPRVAPPSLLSRVARQLTDPLVLLLLGALAVTLAVRDLTDAIIIGLVIGVNTAIGVTQEARADRAIAALDAMAAPTARVLRDGADQVLPSAEVVVGDLVRLEAGDVVPADLQLHLAHRLAIDEAALTGESVAVERDAGQEAYAGTVVVTGRAVGVVIRTGERSALGRIAAAVARTRPGPTPLQRRLAGLGRLMGLVVVALSAVVFVLGIVRGTPAVAMAITAVSLVVAAVPESLPAVVTVALALGARRMAAQNAIPRRLHAVETLGSVTVVASDKTGTLTEGRMAVRTAIDATGDVYAVDGRGYEPVGTVAGPARSVVPESLQDLARAAVLCADATVLAPTPEHPDWRPAGDPMEAALYVFAARCGLTPDKEREEWERVDEIPFDAQTRRMSTAHVAPDGRAVVVCKGAPEAVLMPAVIEHVPPGVHEIAAGLAERGLRVIAVAAREYGPETTSGGARPTTGTRTPGGGRSVAGAPGAEPVGLRYLGLLGIGDRVRDQAVDTANEFELAGIRLLLITGDHPGTATAVGAEVGIWRPGDAVHNGDQLSGGGPGSGSVGAGATELVDGSTVEGVEQVRVFARVAPESKLDIIHALRMRGNVVAMTGDGVNDAPALRRADIGVAMGKGTEVARQAADLVLVDENLATMAVAVREGRRIYDNIRRFLHYGLSGGAAELLVMLVGPLLGLPLPLLPAQILWINLLTHGIPGVALGAEPASVDTMRRPPRPPEESVLGDGLARAIAWTGLGIAVVALGVGTIGAAYDRPWQSMLFLVLGLSQLGVALAVRAPRLRDGERNPALAGAVAVSALFMIAGVTVPVLRDVLGTALLTPVDWAWCAGASVLPGLAVAVARRAYVRLSADQRGPSPGAATAC
jgi:Ca2+-transporting ATPase